MKRPNKQLQRIKVRHVKFTHWIKRYFHTNIKGLWHMKWFFQYFLSPFLAALLALYGNYVLVAEPQLNKDYTKIGLDILMQQDAPKHIQTYAQQLLNDNSPIKLSKSERDERLDYLLKNIPIAPALLDEEIKTNGDLAALALLYVRWAQKVRDLCSECVSEKYFIDKYREAKQDFASLVN